MDKNIEFRASEKSGCKYTSKGESDRLREKNNCSKCLLRGDRNIGCTIFSAEPEDCWMWTDNTIRSEQIERDIEAYSGRRRR